METAKLIALLVGMVTLLSGLIAWVGLRAQKKLSSISPRNPALARLTPTGLALCGCLILLFVVGAAVRKLAPGSELGTFLNRAYGVPVAMMLASLGFGVFAAILERLGHPIAEWKEAAVMLAKALRRPPRVLETLRLRLRPPTEADIDAIFEYASDADVTRFMDWRRLEKRDEVYDFLSRTEREWSDGTEFMWVITEKGVDTVIGGISIRPRETDADFGYVLGRRFWNRGIATEAATVVTWWALSTRGLPRIWATCDVENSGSMRVLEKVGLVREGLVPGGVVRPNLSTITRDTYLYSRARANLVGERR